MSEQGTKESEPQKPKDASASMAMVEEMMDQTGRGDGPMAMMQKMMVQMGHGEGGLPMECMMNMCTEMIAAVRQTAAFAVFGTPELQHIFGDWLKSVEAKAVEIVAKGETDSASLAAALNIGEETANYILTQLASGALQLI